MHTRVVTIFELATFGHFFIHATQMIPVGPPPTWVILAPFGTQPDMFVYYAMYSFHFFDLIAIAYFFTSHGTSHGGGWWSGARFHYNPIHFIAWG